MPSIIPFGAMYILKTPWLYKIVKPMADWYTNLAGYRKFGLRADDLIPEEDENVLLAIKRLPQKEQYDRVFRIRRAVQVSVSKKELPTEEWCKPEDDIPYLTPVLIEIEQEQKERADLDSLTLRKK